MKVNARTLNRVAVVLFAVLCLLLLADDCLATSPKLKKESAIQMPIVSPYSQFGSRGGIFAGMTTLGSELAVHNIPKNPLLGWRAAFISSTGLDSFSVRRNHYTFSMDLLFRKFDTMKRKGWYLAGGPNIILVTTGQRFGSVGYQLAGGYEWKAKTYQAYVELGYGTLRTGFSPDTQGLNFLIGIYPR